MGADVKNLAGEFACWSAPAVSCGQAVDEPFVLAVPVLPIFGDGSAVEFVRQPRCAVDGWPELVVCRAGF